MRPGRQSSRTSAGPSPPKLFGEDDPIGQTSGCATRRSGSIGVMASKGQSAFGQDQDDAIFVPLDAGAGA
jgi:putative ABC transport system permease protein